MPRILIIGAGPTGLGAAWRLQELGHADWLLLEGAAGPGGLSASVRDPQGFTWDLGGHVVFSHYAYFDRLLDDLLGEEWIRHVREAWVRMRQRFIPYPLQNNLWRLPPDDLARCLEGLREVQGATLRPGAPDDFRQWLFRQFGRGLGELFMIPYNRKVWGYDPARLDTGWMAQRVAPVNLAEVLRAVEQQQDHVSWGPNATFRFPRRGGTGAIWKALAARLPADRLRYRTPVTAVDTARKLVQCADGTRHAYDFLITTMPLDRLLRSLTDQPGLHPLADGLVHSSTHVVGIGLDHPAPEAVRTKCWIYFPEPTPPCYRVTVFSNYAPDHVPRPGEQCSFLCEVTESPDKPVTPETLVSQVEEGLRQDGLCGAPDRVLSRWHTRLEYGYPTPFLGRDRLLSRVEPALRPLGILSRGRFGAWKYEVGNQDHSVMQGVEAVNHLLCGEDEVTCHHPERVNR